MKTVTKAGDSNTARAQRLPLQSKCSSQCANTSCSCLNLKW